VFIKKFGFRTLAFVIILILLTAVLYVFYREQLISIYTFSVLAVMGVALMILNVLERLHLMEKEGEKLVKEGEALFKKGETHAALDRFKEALLYDGDCFGARIGIGLYCRLQKKYKEAIQEFKMAAILDPSSPMPHYYAGLCHQREGDDKQAVKELEKALKMNRSLVEACFALGEIHYKQGNSEQAKLYFQRYLEAPADEENARHAREKLEMTEKIIQAHSG
jgi:tetratricopeptide (TPR) repeat protein